MRNELFIVSVTLTMSETTITPSAENASADDSTAAAAPENTTQVRQTEPAKKKVPDSVRLRTAIQYHGYALLAAFGIWAATDAWLTSTGLTLASVMSVIAAFAAGSVLATIFHEWGHFIGARLAGSHSPMVYKPVTAFIFGFSFEKNTREQFLSMSLGGPVANWLLVLIVALMIPIDNAGRAMLLATVAGRAIAVVLFEGPVIMRVWNREDPKESLDIALNDGSQDKSRVHGWLAILIIWLIAV
ncbi:MAG: hypothetical protein KDI36_07395 [Pseudomonadales bacterium]|nr:hypothetical protein [Pseudomonadales bacterium]